MHHLCDSPTSLLLIHRPRISVTHCALPEVPLDAPAVFCGFHVLALRIVMSEHRCVALFQPPLRLIGRFCWFYSKISTYGRLSVLFFTNWSSFCYEKHCTVPVNNHSVIFSFISFASCIFIYDDYNIWPAVHCSLQIEIHFLTFKLITTF